MPESAREFEKALLKKGFRLERQNTDKLFFLYYDNKRTQIWTKVSHGRGEELRAALLSKIKHQMQFDTTDQLVRFIDCSLSHAEYIEFLTSKDAL